MRKPRVWIPLLVAVIMLTLAASSVLVTRSSTHQDAYQMCAPEAIRHLPRNVVGQVNAAQRKYQVPPDGRELASRTLSETYRQSVLVVFMPAYCGYLEALALTPTRSHSLFDMNAIHDTVTRSYHGRPLNDHVICISKDMPSWTRDAGRDGAFHVTVVCDRVYSWDTWQQESPVLTETREPSGTPS